MQTFKHKFRKWKTIIYEKIIDHEQVGFGPGMQVCLALEKSINVIDYINKLKKKNYMIISIGSEKLLVKFNIYTNKNFQELQIEEKEIPIAGITLNGERVNDFYLKKAKRRRCLYSLFLFNIILEVWVSAMKLEKENASSKK